MEAGDMQGEGAYGSASSTSLLEHGRREEGSSQGISGVGKGSVVRGGMKGSSMATGSGWLGGGGGLEPSEGRQLLQAAGQSPPGSGGATNDGSVSLLLRVQKTMSAASPVRHPAPHMHAHHK